MNTIGDNTCQYHNIQFQKSGNRKQGDSRYTGVLVGDTDAEDSGKVQGIGMSVQDAYARMKNASGNKIAEEMDDNTKQVEEHTGQESEMIGGVEAEKVTDIWVVTLFSKGVNICYNEDTGELKCIELGRANAMENPLWSRKLSGEEYEKCSQDLFVRYPYEGDWKFTYEPYLKQEKFWDMYLTGKYDPETLAEHFASDKQSLA